MMQRSAASLEMRSRGEGATPGSAVGFALRGRISDLLVDLTAEGTVRRFQAGTTILHQGGEPATSLYVVRAGHVEIRVDGRLVDLPGPGEVFGELSLLSGTPPTATVRAMDDLECLLVDRPVAERILGSATGVAFVQASLRRSTSRTLGADASQMADAIEEADDEVAAVARFRTLPVEVCSMAAAGADAVSIGREVGSVVDALTKRLLRFAIEDLGPAPVPWAWLALGSQARLEQALHTDQDHALAFDPGGRSPEELDPYFAELAERVTAGLEAGGIPRCRGNAMAVRADLRRPIGGWDEAIRGWMADQGRGGSVLSSIAFDFRQIDGPLDAEPALHAVITRTSKDRAMFLRHLTRRALDQKPPTGFVRNLVVESKGEHAGRLDIKHGGITIVANIARAYAIASGRPQKGTLDRLMMAEADGRMNPDRRQALEEAFRLLWQVRLEHQVGQVERGDVPDDFVDPASLGPITRMGLKEAFKIVTREQRSLAAELRYNS